MYSVILEDNHGRTQIEDGLSADGVRNLLSYCRLGMWQIAKTDEDGNSVYPLPASYPVYFTVLPDTSTVKTRTQFVLDQVSGSPLTVRQSAALALPEVLAIG